MKMETLKYTVIKNEEQYRKYCDILEELVAEGGKDKQDEIELVTLLIEQWDLEHNTFNDLDPVELLKYLMEQNRLMARDIANILGLSKGTVSKILNYHKGFSKETIRKLSEYFKVSHEAFNRPYPLKKEFKRRPQDARLPEAN